METTSEVGPEILALPSATAERSTRGWRAAHGARGIRGAPARTARMRPGGVVARTRLRAAANDGGFTLVEMLIVVVIVGLIAALAMIVFFAYARDAKAAEAKALAGSVLKVLEGCAQARGSAGSC